MSEISRDMNASTEMDMKMDLFQYYIHGIGGLLSADDDDDIAPSSGLTSPRLAGVGNASFRNSEVAREATGFSSLFCNAAGHGLSGHGKERMVVAMLRRSVVALNEEVDEMLDPVLAMLRLRALLAPQKDDASHPEAEFEERAQKRLKVNEPLNVGSDSCNLTEEGSLSGRRSVAELEPGKAKSLTRCNNMRCGNYARKSNFDETKSLCGDCCKQGMNESFLGSSSRDDKENGEVNDDLQVLLVNRGPKVEEKMEKHSAELSATLERMKEKLEELVDIAVSSCREMTLAEKHQLNKLIQNLQPQRLDRVVEIIHRGKPPENKSSDDIIVDLQNLDNSTLWRLYFHVKAIENARKLL